MRKSVKDIIIGVSIMILGGLIAQVSNYAYDAYKENPATMETGQTVIPNTSLIRSCDKFYALDEDYLKYQRFIAGERSAQSPSLYYDGNSTDFSSVCADSKASGYIANYVRVFYKNETSESMDNLHIKFSGGNRYFLAYTTRDFGKYTEVENEDGRTFKIGQLDAKDSFYFVAYTTIGSYAYDVSIFHSDNREVPVVQRESVRSGFYTKYIKNDVRLFILLFVTSIASLAFYYVINNEIKRSRYIEYLKNKDKNYTDKE